MALGNKFTIDSIQAVGIPMPINKRNQFDELGELLGLPRFLGEKNDLFKRRLADVYVHIANSSYRGLVYGITRELGLSLFNPLSINPKTDGDGNFLSADPLIVFDGSWILLYSDYSNNQLDWAIDRYQKGGNYEHLDKLINFINTTVYFEAQIEPNIDLYTRSMTILNQSNRELVPAELVPLSQHYSLEHKYLVEGTVLFSDLETYRTEVNTVAEILAEGQYQINYKNGIVTSFSAPVSGTRVRYQYTKFPFKPIASPVILSDISNDNFRIKLFEQVLLDDGSYSNGLPTELGADILNELYSCYASYWGT